MSVIHVRDGVALPTTDQRAIHGECEGPGDDEATEERSPKAEVAEPLLDRAWDKQYEAVVDQLHDCDRHRVCCKRNGDDSNNRETRPQQRSDVRA